MRSEARRRELMGSSALYLCSRDTRQPPWAAGLSAKAGLPKELRGGKAWMCLAWQEAEVSCDNHTCPCVSGPDLYCTANGLWLAWCLCLSRTSKAGRFSGQGRPSWLLFLVMVSPSLEKWGVVTLTIFHSLWDRWGIQLRGKMNGNLGKALWAWTVQTEAKSASFQCLLLPGGQPLSPVFAKCQPWARFDGVWAKSSLLCLLLGFLAKATKNYAHMFTYKIWVLNWSIVGGDDLF